MPIFSIVTLLSAIIVCLRLSLTISTVLVLLSIKHYRDNGLTFSYREALRILTGHCIVSICSVGAGA